MGSQAAAAPYYQCRLRQAEGSAPRRSPVRAVSPPRPAPFRRRRVTSADPSRTRWRRWASRCGWSEVSAAVAPTGASAVLCCGRVGQRRWSPWPGRRHTAAAYAEPLAGHRHCQARPSPCCRYCAAAGAESLLSAGRSRS